jgi:hypothetical protein
VPALTRCPSCSAALAPGASWCSLCHADLRPKLEPLRRSHDVVPGTAATGTAVAAAPAEAETETRTGVEPVEPDHAAVAVVDDPPPRGRHSRGDEEPVPAPATRPASGRHAAGRRPAPPRRRERAAVILDEPLDLGDVAPEDVDEVAEKMLSRLAATEERTRFLNPDDLPGGKAVFIAGAAFAVLVVLIVLYTILGAILD